jgi:hypothetical protein
MNACNFNQEFPGREFFKVAQNIRQVRVCFCRLYNKMYMTAHNILKRKWFAKEHVLFCINPALKMLGDALHRLRFLPWFDTK